MGGMLPTVAMSALQMGMDISQQNAQQKAVQAEAKADAQSQTDQIRQTQEIQSRERQQQLRRALATQRARFGAQGIGGGSADATLSGLEAEAQRDEMDAQNISDMRVDKINDDLEWQQRRNLLAASTPRYRSAFSLVQRSLRSVPLLDGD